MTKTGSKPLAVPGGFKYPPPQARVAVPREISTMQATAGGSPLQPSCNAHDSLEGEELLQSSSGLAQPTAWPAQAREATNQGPLAHPPAAQCERVQREVRGSVAE